MMARSKSTPGSKASRTNTNTTKEQSVSGNPPNVLAENAVAGETIPAESTPASAVMPEVKGTPETRRLEVVRNESRKNVVPINLEDEIRRRAYELYQQRGSGTGSEADDWLAAEREVRQRYRQQSA